LITNLRSAFSSLSIRSKLILLTTLTALITLSGAVAAFITSETTHYTRLLDQELSALGQMIARASRAALVFNDDSTARLLLDAAQARDNIVGAVLERKDGTTAADFYKNNFPKDLIPLIRTAPEQIRDRGFRTISEPVFLDDERVGTVYLISNLQNLQAQIDRFTWIGIIVFGACSIVAFLLSSFSQRFVSRPLVNLLDVARRVSQTGDHSIRAAAHGTDEIGQLVTGFNEMLQTLQKQDSEVRSAKERAERADRAKSDFLATMSHEVRNPINGIMGLTRLMYDTKLTAEQNSYVNMMKVVVDSLLTLINDLLDIAKIEESKIELAPRPTNVYAFFKRITDVPRLRAKTGKIELSVKIDPKVPPGLIVDPDRLGQVISNLLGNATKFSQPDTEITLTVDAEHVKDNTYTISIAVKDQGIGIAPEELKTVFQPFFQSRRPEARGRGGTGLGLTISCELVRLMEGEIDVTSTLGVGTTFHVSFPAEATDNYPAAPLDEHASSQVESSPTGSEITSGAVFGQLKGGPIIRRSGHILLVEDNLINQLTMTEMLRRRGYLVTVGSHGQEGVTLARNTKFDLILMDCQMPIMDGFEAVQEIRRFEEAKSRHTPIVGVTAHAMRGDRERILSWGMDGYLAKPILEGELEEILATFLPASNGKATERNTPTREAAVPDKSTAATAPIPTGSPASTLQRAISHDLWEPLRGISTLSNWLRQDQYERLDSSGREQLDLLIGRVQRLQAQLKRFLDSGNLQELIHQQTRNN
jgi:signal transduction histidine kinase